MSAPPAPGITPISVIVPVLDEAAGLPALLDALAEPSPPREIIVADGGSRDAGPRLARRAGARVVSSPPGRGRQLAAGARAATGEVLWFLHADTLPPPGAAAALLRALEDPRVVGGKFPIRFPHRHPVLDAVAAFSRFSSAWTSYGDGGFFVRREIYERMGGMEDVPLFEDVRFFRRLRQMGQVAVVPKPLTTSCRRFCRGGPWRRLALNGLLVAAHRAGVGPHRLAGWYRPAAVGRVEKHPAARVESAG